ncbi:MAG: SURF1 family protein [Paracoccaceae bacterium]
MLRRMIFPVLMGLVGVGVLCALGVWQLQRMEWKRGYLDAITAMISADPVGLPEVVDPVADKYRPVFVEGAFTGQVIEVLSSQRMQGVGVRVIEVLDAGGRRVLVDRGFVAEDQRSQPRIVREVRVEGNLHWPEDTNAYTPPPDSKTGLWYARDVAAMAVALDTDAVLVVAAADTGDGIAPVPVDITGIPNDHWGYAITWFSLAVVWAGMTAYLLWRIRRQTV